MVAQAMGIYGKVRERQIGSRVIVSQVGASMPTCLATVREEEEAEAERTIATS